LFKQGEIQVIFKNVFVFGTGASYASARAPLGKDLVWHYYRFRDFLNLIYFA